MKETDILQRDFTEPLNIFPADMLQQMERTNVKEKAIVSKDKVEYKLDYPILCYKKSDE